MIETAWKLEFSADERQMWRDSISGYGASEASAGVISLYERQRTQRPTLADLRRSIERLHATDGHVVCSDDPSVTWVNVWAWARWKRGDRRSFPQQQLHVIPDMTMAEYQQLEAEWREDGAPKLDVRQLAQALGR